MAESHKFKKLEHPLGWGDTELAYLVGQGLDHAALYRAMGYKLKPGNAVPVSFKIRIERLMGQEQQG